MGRRVAMLLGVALLVAAVVLWVLAMGDDESHPAGSWVEVVSPPVAAGQHVAPAVGVDGRVVVWGGDDGRRTRFFDEGAVHDSHTSSWQRVAPAPFPGRSGHVMIAMDDQVLVCCGRTATADRTTDAAVYDVSDDQWTSLPDAPIAIVEPAVASWTSREVVIFSHDDNGGAVGFVLDPDGPAWRTIPDVPVSVDEATAAVWTGTEVALTGQHDGPALALYSPASGRWRTVSWPDEATPVIEPSLVWTGNELILWGAAARHRTATAGYSYRPSSDRWDALPDAGIHTTARTDALGGGHAAVWAQGRIVIYGGHLTHAAIPRAGDVPVFAYHPQTRRWSGLPSVPSRAWYSPQLLEVGQRLWLATSPTWELSHVSDQPLDAIQWNWARDHQQRTLDDGRLAVTVTATSSPDGDPASPAIPLRLHNAGTLDACLLTQPTVSRLVDDRWTELPSADDPSVDLRVRPGETVTLEVALTDEVDAFKTVRIDVPVRACTQLNPILTLQVLVDEPT